MRSYILPQYRFSFSCVLNAFAVYTFDFSTLCAYKKCGAIYDMYFFWCNCCLAELCDIVKLFYCALCSKNGLCHCLCPEPA